MIDGTGAAPIANATIVMKDRRITAIGGKGSVTVPQGAIVIDGTGKYVTPGFMDIPRIIEETMHARLLHAYFAEQKVPGLLRPLRIAHKD